MKITGAKLPNSGSKSTANKSRVSFGSNVKEGDQNKSSPLSCHICCAFKRSNPSQRCAKAAVPGNFFCSSDHVGWDKKAAANGRISHSQPEVASNLEVVIVPIEVEIWIGVY